MILENHRYASEGLLTLFEILCNYVLLNIAHWAELDVSHSLMRPLCVLRLRSTLPEIVHGIWAIGRYRGYHRYE